MIPLFFSGLFLSLGWLIRGQFGHEWGAAVPGGMAAAAVAILMRPSVWKQSFASSVFWSAAGFALGGGFSFGSLVGEVTSAPSLMAALPQLIEIFFIGAVWGGLGSLFLGFGLSSQQTTLKEAVIFGLAALFVWAVNNLFNVSNRIAIGIALIVFIGLISYRRLSKTDPLAECLGIFGFFGFGTGFVLSTLLLYFGAKGVLSGTWWQVSDFTWGFFGGAAIYLAASFASGKSWLPQPNTSTLAQRGGFLVFCTAITGLNLWNVYQKWFQSTPPPVNMQIAYAALAAFLLGIIVVSIWILRADPSKFSMPALSGTLRCKTFFYFWFLGLLAIAKTIVYSGSGYWENVFTAIVMVASVLTLYLFISAKAEAQ